MSLKVILNNNEEREIFYIIFNIIFKSNIDGNFIEKVVGSENEFLIFNFI